MIPQSLAALGGLLFSAGTLARPQATNTASSSNDIACNNSPDLCDRAYNDVTYMGAHNIPFLRDESTDHSLAGNQFLNATRALDAGLRLLQGQVHLENDGELYLCHSLCALLNGGRLSTWLSEVRFWMDQNPNEVVTIVLVNSDDASAAQFAADFQSAGIDQYGFVPSSTGATSNWPSLRTMIDNGTRMVSFIASITPDSTYPYLLPQFAYVFETDFEVLNITEFNCLVDRPSSLVEVGGAAAISQSNYMSMINHFAYKPLVADVLIPNVEEIDTTNSESTTTVGALGTHVNQCRSEWGARPNFVLVDFWDRGEVVAVGDSMNSITNGVGRTDANSDTGESSNESGTFMNAAAKFDAGRKMALVAFLGASVVMF